jgi:hypothetical protein
MVHTSEQAQQEQSKLEELIGNKNYQQFPTTTA